MKNQEKKYELIKFEDGDFSLDVNVSPDEDTVWLTQNDMALLFDVDRSRITRHINNIFDEFELEPKCNVRKTHFPFSDKMVNIYNLDVILAVGYRVKSKRGILFRRWANSILKQYLLKGHVINEDRCLNCTSNIISLENKYRDIEERLNNIEENLYSSESIIYEGEILEPYTFLRKLFFLAKNELIIIDYYADKFLLSMLLDIKINIEIITSSNSYLNKEKIPNNIKITIDENDHDRFIIIDDIVYAIGTSFNGIGKGKFVMIKLKNLNKVMILKK